MFFRICEYHFEFRFFCGKPCWPEVIFDCFFRMLLQIIWSLCPIFHKLFFLLGLSAVANEKYSFRVNFLFSLRKIKIIHWFEKIRGSWIEKCFSCLRTKVIWLYLRFLTDSLSSFSGRDWLQRHGRSHSSSIPDSTETKPSPLLLDKIMTFPSLQAI